MLSAKERQAVIRRARKATKVVHEVAGFTGYGPNITGAKANWLAQVEEALEGNYRPVVITVEGRVLLVWRMPHLGWTYQIIRPESGKAQGYNPDGWGSGYASKDEVLATARNHLAQDSFEFDGRTGLCVLTDETSRNQHVRWVQWQYSYRAWLSTGLTSNEAHERASRNQWPEGTPIPDIDNMPE